MKIQLSSPRLAIILLGLVFLAYWRHIQPSQDLTIVPYALMAGLAIVFRLPERRQQTGLFCFLVAAFWCILIGRWVAGLSDGSSIGGKIPFTDASGYLNDAIRLFDGWPLSSFSSRRPIHVLVLSGFLKLANGNFAIACFLMPIFIATGLTALTMAVRRTLGSAAAYVFVFLAILFYRRFIGTALSEHAGFAFGCLAASLLWRGAERRSLAELCGGLFLLTIALVARAGCFFVLPALVIWIAWRMRRVAWLNWKALSLAAGSVIAGFALNNALLHVFGTPGSSFANFPVTLYGLITGGDWHSFYVDYPAIAALPESEAAPKIVAIVLERLQQNPWLLWRGALRAWRDFFSTDAGQFLFMRFGFNYSMLKDLDLNNPVGSRVANFLQNSPDLVRKIGFAIYLPWIKTFIFDFLIYIIKTCLFDLGPWFLFFIGIISMIVNFRQPQHCLLLACWIGIFPSIPFNSPWDSDLMRSYAATMPLQLLSVAVGASAIQAYMRSRLRRPTIPFVDESLIAQKLGLSMAAALLPLLCLIRLTMPTSPTQAEPAHHCSSGTARLARMLSGTEIILSTKLDGLQALPPERFQSGLSKILTYGPEGWLVPFESLAEGTVVFAATLLDRPGYVVVAVRDQKSAAAFKAEAQPICLIDDSPLINESDKIFRE
jgi:hypothetical protein